MNFFIKQQSFNLRFTGGKYDEWFAAHQKLSPDKPLEVWYLLGKRHLEEAEKRIDEISAAGAAEFWDLAQNKAMLFALKGDFQAAKAEIPAILANHPRTKPTYHHAAYDIACIYALKGDSGESLGWLREAASTGLPNYPLFARDPYLDRIRQAPEFVGFMADMQAQHEKFRREFAR